MLDEKRFLKGQQNEPAHNLIMESRAKVSISGVEDVESFDEECVILYTPFGTLTLKGEQMHINKLSIESGEVIIEGEITSCAYSGRGGRDKGGFLGRLFK